MEVEGRLRDYAENGEDYTVQIKLENKNWARIFRNVLWSDN